MPKTTALFLIVQYTITGVLKSTEKAPFGYGDLLLYICFFIQSIAVLGVMFMHINSKSEIEQTYRAGQIIKTLNNLVIFLGVFIIVLNFSLHYLVSLLQGF